MAIHAIKTNEKQIEDLTEEQARRDSKYSEDIESLNKLLKDTEETTQQKIDGLNADLAKAHQEKLTAEYAEAEVKGDLEEVKDKLSEAQAVSTSLGRE